MIIRNIYKPRKRSNLNYLIIKVKMIKFVASTMKTWPGGVAQFSYPTQTKRRPKIVWAASTMPGFWLFTADKTTALPAPTLRW